MNDRAPTVVADKLSVCVKGKTILEGCSFRIERGESATIIGRNGAGKTTLLKCIGGLTRATAGSVHVEGRLVSDCPPRERARLMAYVPQSAGIVLTCTAYDFVVMARYAHFKTPLAIAEANKSAALEAMKTTGTVEFRNRRLNTLSGGERQKVFIAAALAQGSPILLLDEPAAFLDYSHEAELAALVQRLNKESGLTVISVTHDLNQGALECDRVVALHCGKLVFCGPPDGLSSPDVLRSIYQTPFDIVEHGGTGRSIVIPLRRRP
ncbi:MAG: ABC transporter ATP-binding protein [Candidatus Hydrogenedentes bacterium]|nr:ABC transporter ATP-binding protein [Candidatus Hydrogenedentota bacterium]